MRAGEMWMLFVIGKAKMMKAEVWGRVATRELS